MKTELSVNVDHVATLRQARGGREPDPVQAAVQALTGGLLRHIPERSRRGG